MYNTLNFEVFIVHFDIFCHGVHECDVEAKEEVRDDKLGCEEDWDEIPRT